MKILFITRRPIGLIATPGTYLSVEAYSEAETLRILTHETLDSTEQLVRQPKKDLDIRKHNFESKDIVVNIQREVALFEPDIVCIGCFVPNQHTKNKWTGWGPIAKGIKETNKTLPVVLEIKSPSIKRGKGLQTLKNLSEQYQSYLDAIIAPSKKMAETWFETQNTPFLTHKSIIDQNSIRTKIPEKEIIKSTKFIFAGSLTKKRNLTKLLSLIASLPSHLRKQFSLDIYGDGPDRTVLETTSQMLGICQTVKFKGLISQAKLYSKYCQYDCGIAWVPSELYDSAPSLKLAEYCSAGLVPIATDTYGHKMLSKEGFDVKYFTENLSSFTQVIEDVMEQGFDAAKLNQNAKNSEIFNYSRVINSEILPFYRKIIQGEVSNTLDADKMTSDKNIRNQFEELGFSNSDKVIEKLEKWVPAQKPTPMASTSRKEHKVAAILSERLYYGLKEECNLLPLVEGQWENLIKDTSIDFLLVESCLFTFWGDWRFALTQGLSPQLTTLLETAKITGIPSVLWITVDVTYAEIYEEAARLFDLVYVADQRMQTYLSNIGISCTYLAPAIQPRHFNPLRPLELGIPDFGAHLISGSRVLEKNDEIAKLVSELPHTDFSIFERDHYPDEHHLDRINKLSEQVNYLGKISHYMLPQVLKSAESTLMDANAKITPTEMHWQITENTACMCQTLILNSKAPVENTSTAKYFSTIADLKQHILETKSNPISFTSEKHKAWRQVFSQDKFEQRFRTICTDLGIQKLTAKAPSISILSPTMRAGQLARILENFRRQTHTKLELVIVANGAHDEYKSIKEATEDIDNITVCFLPEDHHAASAINYGFKFCTGDYIARFDDDDFYGENYLTDFSLMLNAVDAELAGKSASFVKIDGDENIYMQKNAKSDRNLRTYSGSELSQKHGKLSGATFLIKRTLLENVPFPDESLVSADAAYLEAIRKNVPNAVIMKTDWFNFTIGRHSDSKNHTWSANLNSIIANNPMIDDTSDEIPR